MLIASSAFRAVIALIAQQEHRSSLIFDIIRSNNNIRKSEPPFMFVNKKTEKGMGLTRAQVHIHFPPEILSKSYTHTHIQCDTLSSH